MEQENRRKRLFMQFSLGSVITLVLALGSAAAVWAQLKSDITENREKVAQIEKREAQNREDERSYRVDTKQDLRDVKTDVKDIKSDINKILLELSRQGKSR